MNAPNQGQPPQDDGALRRSLAWRPPWRVPTKNATGIKPLPGQLGLFRGFTVKPKRKRRPRGE
jgi:hypothetical protein